MGIQIKATFLDEITADIPHQNWGKEEWDKDFAAMKAVGIDTVIMIRSGLEKFITYPSKILIEEFGCYEPPVDLVDMFLELAEKYEMRYFFGTYCLRHNGHYKDVDVDARWSIEKRLIDEVWERYGHRKAFKGWYLAKEISGNDEAIVREFVNYSSYCKKISGNLPTLISPGMLGRKAWMPNEPGAHDLDFEHHERTWDTIMKAISGHVDIIAFQDGHVTYEELGPAMALNTFHEATCRHNNLTIIPRHIPRFKGYKTIDGRSFLYRLNKIAKLFCRIKTNSAGYIRRRFIELREVFIA